MNEAKKSHNEMVHTESDGLVWSYLVENAPLASTGRMQTPWKGKRKMGRASSFLEKR